ncbi:MAG: M48 family metallopeptidase [candidate division WOR-3 bacterium]
MRKKKFHPLIDEEKQQIARKYHKEHRVVNVVSSAVSIVILLLIIGFQISQKFFGVITDISDLRIIQAFLYFVVFYSVYFLISLPFGFIGGYRIEHKYNFSTQTIKGWFMDEIKSFIVGLVLGLIVIEVLYLITFSCPKLWWLYLSILMILFSVVLANLFPVLILPLFYKTTPLADGNLKERIKEICGKAKMKIEGVFTINLSSKSTKANAMVVGLGNTKKILLGDTLISKYNENEIIATLCHEITHYQQHHIWYLILWNSIITFIVFYLLYRIHPVFYRLAGFENISDIAGFPLFVLLFGLLSFLLKPIISGISRFYEKKADAGALTLSENPQAFIELMAKFCNQELTIAYPHPLIEFYSYSHPSIGRRIEFAEKFQKENHNA